MLTVIKQFFSAELETNQLDDTHTLQLAAAALLIELTRADFQREPEELEAVKNALQKTFPLSAEQLQTLLDLAEQEAQQATSLYQFTRLINDHYSQEKKAQLIELMWHVAATDGEICKYEDHLIRKIAELLYVPHQVFIRGKLAVLEGH